MANLVEMVNGRLQHMSDADQSSYIENQAFITQQSDLPQPPDLATQVANLTAAVVALGGSVPEAQIADSNTKLQAIGDLAISSIKTLQGV